MIGSAKDLPKKLTVGSMFAGIGGICYAFKQAGAEVVWANEIDKYACKTYRENLSNHLVEGDIRDIDPAEIPDIDILTSGFPCQAFSIAGYRKGFQDERGNLFFETVRILKAKKPKALFIENVKNLVSHDNGKTFKIISDALHDAGYHFKHKVMNSMEYGNVPQNRERIYIVGFRDKNLCDKFEFPKPIPLTETIDDVICRSEKKPDKYYYTEKSKYYNLLKEHVTKRDTIYQLRRTYVRENKKGVCPTLTANMGTGGHNVPIILDDYGIRKLTPQECFAFQGFVDKFFFMDTLLFEVAYSLPIDLSDTQLYKQAGNTVTVPVVRRIAENMIKVMEGVISQLPHPIEGGACKSSS